MSDSSDSKRPLSGIKVLDLTQALAGPFGSLLLADMGADVIKVEPPRGDLTRTTPPHYIEGESLYFLSLNRDKRSIVLDLKSAEGYRVFLDLVRWADVVYSNFGPGVVDRLGIGHEALKAIRNDIITCEISGFGAQGPDSSKRAVDVVIQAAAGGISITGQKDMPPVRAGIPTADLSAGMFSIIGILAALAHKARTGEGTSVKTSLFESQLNLLSYVAAYAMFSGINPPPMGSGHMGTVPSQAFETKDGHIVIEAGFNHHFSALCEAIGMPELAKNPNYIDRPSRSRHRGELLDQLTNRFKEEATDYWYEQVSRAGIPCAPVNNVLSATSSPQSVAVDAVATVMFRGVAFQALASPISFDGSKGGRLADPPALGGNTEEILSGVLGYNNEEIRSLIRSQAVAASTGP